MTFSKRNFFIERLKEGYWNHTFWGATPNINDIINHLYCLAGPFKIVNLSIFPPAKISIENRIEYYTSINFCQWMDFLMIYGNHSIASKLQFSKATGLYSWIYIF
jgi:hypothetical protein